MAKPQKKASTRADPLPEASALPLDDERLSASERRNLAQADRDRAAGLFLPLREALDVARRGRTRRRPRPRARLSR